MLLGQVILSSIYLIILWWESLQPWPALLTLGLFGSSQVDRHTGSRPQYWNSHNCRGPEQSHIRWCLGNLHWTVRIGSRQDTCTCSSPGCCDRRLLHRCEHWGIHFHLQGKPEDTTYGILGRGFYGGGWVRPLWPCAGQRALILALGKERQVEVTEVGKGTREKDVETDVASHHMVSKRGLRGQVHQAVCWRMAFWGPADSSPHLKPMVVCSALQEHPVKNAGVVHSQVSGVRVGGQGAVLCIFASEIPSNGMTISTAKLSHIPGGCFPTPPFSAWIGLARADILQEVARPPGLPFQKEAI